MSVGQPVTLRYEGPVIDIHTHVFFEGQTAAMRSTDDLPETLLQVTSDAQIELTGVITVAPAPGIDKTRRLNDRLADFVRAHPRRLFAIGTVHPDDGAEAVAEVERIHGLGFRMLKLHPITQRFDVSSESVSAVVRRAGELGMPVLMDFSGVLNAKDFGQYLLLAMQNPGTQLILAHMGGTHFHEVLILSELEKFGWYSNNIWFDLSEVSAMYAGSPYADELVHVIRAVGVERFLFGSDFPFARAPSQAIEDVEALGLTAEEQRMIFHDNAARLLGLETR